MKNYYPFVPWQMHKDLLNIILNDYFCQPIYLAHFLLNCTGMDAKNFKSTLIQVMAWCHRTTSHYLSQSCSRSMLPYGITRSQWVNSLGPSDAIWQQRSGSTLAQVMACCLTAPSHYLNQCWLIISKAEWHSSKGKFTRDNSAINHWNYLEN